MGNFIILCHGQGELGGCMSCWRTIAGGLGLAVASLTAAMPLLFTGAIIFIFKRVVAVSNSVSLQLVRRSSSSPRWRKSIAFAVVVAIVEIMAGASCCKSCCIFQAGREEVVTVSVTAIFVVGSINFPLLNSFTTFNRRSGIFLSQLHI